MSERKKIIYYVCDKKALHIYKISMISGEIFDLLPESHKKWFSLNKKYWITHNCLLNKKSKQNIGSELINSININSLSDLLSIVALSFNYIAQAPAGQVEGEYMEINGLQVISLIGYLWRVSDIEQFIINNNLYFNLNVIQPLHNGTTFFTSYSEETTVTDNF